MTGGRDIKRAELTCNWSRPLLNRHVTIFSGFGVVMGWFQNMNLLTVIGLDSHPAELAQYR